MNEGQRLVGWQGCCLDDVAQVVRGITFPTTAKRFKAADGLIACLRTTNVQATVEWDDLWFVPREYVKNDDQHVRDGDILISTANSYELVGKVARIAPLEQEASLGAFISLLRAERGVDHAYLYYLMASEGTQRAIRSMASTTTNLSNVSSSKLKELSLIVAPVEEQTRIVEKLEELLSELDAGVAELKAAQRKLARYRQSLLKAAVEGVSDEASLGYPKRPLGELVKSIGQGWSPRCDPKSSDDDRVWAVIKTTAIQPLGFDGAHNKVLPLNLRPREHLELKKGDLLVTRAGPRSRVGVTCLVRAVKKRLLLCDKAYRIKCDEALIDPEFLELVLNAPHMMNQLDSLKTGINDSGLNLTQDRFFTLMISTPSLDEQRKAIESIETQMISIEEQEKFLAHAFKQAAAQRKNILKAAFAGQLVPQDPNDEPASVLLERIRAERAAMGPRTTKRGRKAKENA